MFRSTLFSKAATRPAFSTVIKRTKATQPDLRYDFNALEPFISADIMETHYLKHHRTYINGYNTAMEKLQEAIQAGDVRTQGTLLPAINFNGGGYVNHNLFWENLAPQNAGGGEPPAAGSALAKAISSEWGSLDNLISTTNGKLAGIQGSGWAWIAKDKATGALEVLTTANQDQVPGTHIPIVGIDAWEHAYYLQYKNVKADYFKAIWNVINWKEAVARFE